MSKQHCRMLQCRTIFALKFRPFDIVERCFDIVAQNGNVVDATGNKVACCFDNVASILLLVWTGLYMFAWTTHVIAASHRFAFVVVSRVNRKPTTRSVFTKQIHCIVVPQLVEPRPHQQQCRSNIVECNDSFDKGECCFFDIVAVFGNNVERNFVLLTNSKQIELEHV